MFIKDQDGDYFNIEDVSSFKIKSFNEVDEVKYIVEFIIQNEIHFLLKENMFVPSTNIDDRDFIFDSEKEAKTYLQELLNPFSFKGKQNDLIS